MRRSILTALATGNLAIVLCAVLASDASAVIVDHACEHLRSGTCQNNVWPWPYFCPDRLAVREPFALMTRNGWRRQNLLGPHHFNASSNQLNMAGQIQVRWIMTQAPPEFRQVYIERSIDPMVTAERIAATRSYAGRVTFDGQMPQVYETDLMATGRPAAIVNMTNVKFMDNMPVPVLPANTTIEQ